MPDQGLSKALQTLTLSKPASQVNLMHNGAAMSGPSSPYSPLGMQATPFTMWPILCQPQFQPSTTYVLNGSHRLSIPPATPSSTGYQVMSPLFSHHSRGITMAGVMPASARTEPRRQHATRINRSPYYNVASHHNHVDVNRIREGTDVRTTVGYMRRAW